MDQIKFNKIEDQFEDLRNAYEISTHQISMWLKNGFVSIHELISL